MTSTYAGVRWKDYSLYAWNKSIFKKRTFRRYSYFQLQETPVILDILESMSFIVSVIARQCNIGVQKINKDDMLL